MGRRRARGPGWIRRHRDWRRCPHSHISGIYGDAINHSAGYRLECVDCGRLLDGPVSLFLDARDEQEAELREELAGQIEAYIEDFEDGIDIGAYTNGLRAAIQIIREGEGP